jgi:hypothetical protein
MKPPIIVVDGETVDLFPSVISAERYLEAPDLEGLSIFDADGYRLQANAVEENVSVVGPWTTTRSHVSLRMPEPPLRDRDELRLLLQDHLRATGHRAGDFDGTDIE